MPRVDTHAHVFHRGLPAIAGARYIPAYDARTADYLAFLAAQGIERGVLVQPSFLGSDNSYLMSALREAGGRLAGVAVLEEATDSATLAPLAAAGIRGLRFNLVGRSPEIVAAAARTATLKAADKLGLHIELHADAPALMEAMPHLADFAGPVVIDHFGRPAAGENALEALLALSRDPRLLVKLSAPYRLARSDTRHLAERFIAAFGIERLLWGSDWPWTQFETQAGAMNLLPEAFGLDRGSIAALDANAMKLFFPDRG